MKSNYSCDTNLLACTAIFTLPGMACDDNETTPPSSRRLVFSPFGLFCDAIEKTTIACSWSRRLVVWHNKFLRSFFSIYFILPNFFSVSRSIPASDPTLFLFFAFFAYFTNRPAFSKHPKRDEDVWVLLIKNTRRSDTGLYVCEVNSEPAIKTFHSLAGKLVVLRRQHEPPKNCSTKRTE